MKYIALLVWFVGAVTNLVGQPIAMPFRTIESEEVSLKDIYEIFEDRSGLKWFGGSGKPVVRFDGVNFRAYSSDSTGFDHDTASALIFEDKKGQLWLGTWAGALMRYDSLADKFRVVNDTVSSPRAMMYSFHEDTLGNFWIGSMGGGLLRFHPDTREFKIYRRSKDINTLPDNYVTALAADAAGNLWVGTTGGLCRYRPQTDDFERLSLRSRNTLDTYKYRVIRSLYIEEDKIYIGTYGGLHIYTMSTGHSRHILSHPHPDSLSHNSLFTINADKQGSLWIATQGGGVNRFDRATGKFQHHKHQPGDSKSISGNNLFTLLIDRDGLLWLGVEGSSVCVHDFSRKKFNWLGHSSVPALPSDRVKEFYRQNDSIAWLGYNGAGLCRINLNTSRVIQFLRDPSDASTISYDKISSIIPDRFDSNVLWIGTEGGGLNRMNLRSGTFKRFEVNASKNRIINNAVAGVHMDERGLIWITTYRDGLSWFDPRQERFYNLHLDSLYRNSGVSFSSMERIVEHDGVIWLSSRHTIVAFDPQSRRFIPVATPPGNLGGVIQASYSEVFPSGGSEVIIFTDRAVLAASYSTENGIRQRKLLDRDGSDEVFRAMIMDKRDHLWYITNRALVRHDLTTDARTVFTSRDGLPNEEFYDLTRDSDGRVFLLTGKGLCWFSPDEIVEDNRSRQVVLTDFKLFNRSMVAGQVDSVTGFKLLAPLRVMRKLELSHHHSVLSISFAALEFFTPGSMEYAYRLVGFDQDWAYVGRQDFATYTNLPAGTYTFEVKAANPDGYWGPATSIDLVVHPPFWRTAWFLSLCGLMLVGLAYAWHRYQLHQSLQVERVRNRIASDLHDEVGSNLTRISMYSDLVQHEPDERERAGYLSMINQVSREVIGTMSDIVWSIDNNRDSLGALVNRIREVAEQLFQPVGVSIDFEAAGLPLDKKLPPEFRQHVFLIAKEALNNAARHAQASRIQIRLSWRKDLLEMTIADNGIGCKAEESSTGNGLRNMQRRADRIGALLRLQNHAGTTVYLEAPLS
jgi:signal transduction histidine kinase/ligand-binding sensor domain-containing protein